MNLYINEKGFEFQNPENKKKDVWLQIKLEDAYIQIINITLSEDLRETKKPWKAYLDLWSIFETKYWLETH